MTAVARHGLAPVGSLASLVGNTPLLRLRALEREVEGVELYAKLEFMNPGGSVKDRAALQMVSDALAEKRFDPKAQRLIDSTSGNTGIALAWIGAALGFGVTLVMPLNVSAARKRITKAYGAELVFSDPLEGSDGAIRHARALIAEDPGRYFYPDQYSNPSNPRAHMLGTAPEIWEQTDGRVTHFVAGVGTTGTVMGTGHRLKQFRQGIQVVAVEPAEAMHGLEGLKHLPSSIVPAIYDGRRLDRTLSITTDEGWAVTERLLKDEGLSVGHSSGANAAGALTVARELAARKEKGVVVTVFCDRADRYFEPQRPKGKFPW